MPLPAPVVPPSQLQGVDWSGIGYNPSISASGLSPEYGKGLFQNIQMAANAANRNRRQNIMDTTGRFGQAGSGMQLQALQGADRDTADQTIQGMGNAQAQGAQLGQQNRQFNAGLAFQGQQGELQRQLQQKMLEQQLAQEQGQFNTNIGQTNLNRLMNLISGGAGAFVGMGGVSGLQNLFTPNPVG